MKSDMKKKNQNYQSPCLQQLNLALTETVMTSAVGEAFAEEDITSFQDQWLWD